jgi:histidine triad (HIT) family protein
VLNKDREQTMQQNDNCVFCKIVQRRIPCDKVYEDDLTLSFMDINPASEGHTLVIVKAHFAGLLDIDETSLAAVAVASRRVARAIQVALQPDGMRVGQFNGAAAGQTVFHYHLHIIPVRTGQKVGSHGRGPGQPEAIRQVVDKIRAALAGLGN